MTVDNKFFRVVLVAIGMTFAGKPAIASDWEWTIAPYLWATDLSLDAKVADGPSLGQEVEFDDLVDKIDTAVMLRAQGRKGGWGGYIDTIFVELSDSNTTTVGMGGPLGGDLKAKTEVDMGVYDFVAFRQIANPQDNNGYTVDLLLGVRYLDVGLDVDVTLPGPAMREVELDGGDTTTDVLLGARVIREYPSNWHWSLHFDLSTGDTDGTRNAMALVGYRFGSKEQFSFDFGYRYMEVEYEVETARGEDADIEMTMEGPLLGFLFFF